MESPLITGNINEKVTLYAHVNEPINANVLSPDTSVNVLTPIKIKEGLFQYVFIIFAILFVLGLT